jgi:hypothetical protein
MNIFKATADFEHWLAGQLPIIRQDLALKHQHMAEAAFPFFRATFYRWLQLWPEICSDLVKAPAVLGVGDLHIENFGTWRDEEGRLIWGVNDLDEAWPAPYALDLVRLVTSVYVAIAEEHLCISRRVAADAIEEGYRDALDAGGKAFILAEDHRWLRLLAPGKLRDPVQFWSRLVHLPPYAAKPPEEVRKLLESSLPSAREEYLLKRRIAGLGSLGHPRVLALSRWRGAFISREAKAIRPSAWVWAKKASSAEIYCEKLMQRSIRVPDRCVHFHGRWVVRRLAPDCSRIELASLSKDRDEARLLYSMGWETANMHFATPQAIAKVKHDLAARRGRWLHKAAKAMLAATTKNWKKWRSEWKSSAPR